MKQTLQSILDGYAIVDSLPLPVMIIRELCEMVYLNHYAEYFFGISRTTIHRYSMETVFPDASLIMRLIQQSIQENRTIMYHEIKINQRNNMQKEVSIHIAPIEQEQGRQFTVVTLYDFSVMHTIENTHGMGSAIQAAKDTTLLLAHEIKNPLSGVRGAAQLLKLVVPEEDKNLTDLICNEVDRIGKLLDSQLEGGKYGLQLKNINIHSVLNHVVKVAEHGFASHVQIESSYDPSLPMIKGDEGLLIQLFINLIKNAAEAIKMRDGKGVIRIVTRYDPDFIIKNIYGQYQAMLPLLVIVQDNGTGITDHMKHQVFNPFVSNKPNGLGIGLTLCKKIVQDHGGIIKMDSDKGKTEVRIHLPVLNSIL